MTLFEVVVVVVLGWCGAIVVFIIGGVGFREVLEQKEERKKGT